MEVSVLDAWRLWLSGRSVVDLTLGGVPILWWGRLGKMAEFGAALAILVDIIGPDRLRAFGNSLHGRFTRGTAARFARDALAWYSAIFRYTFLTGSGSAAQKAALAETSLFKADNLNFGVCAVVSIGGGGFGYWLWGLWWAAVAIILAYPLWLVTLAPIVTVVLVFGAMTLGLLVDGLVIEPLAFILDRERLDNWIKTVSVVLLFLGFHFDLLAS